MRVGDCNVQYYDIYRKGFYSSLVSLMKRR